MDMTIKAVILWPRDTSKEPRIVRFEAGVINVITGDSQTGKSALIPIVDYCLGSGKCAIPVGKIRNTTEWFGVLLRIGESELLLARREPGEQIQTSDMFMSEASSVEIVKRPCRVCGTEAVINRLNQLAGLSSLELAGEQGRNTFGSRPSFRDMAAFEFQPQHIVANPYTLYFKADTYEHQEKLKYVFPLVLGALDNASLELRREIKELERELDTKRRELASRRKAVGEWFGEIKAHYATAREFGLLAEDAPSGPEDWQPQDFLGYLRDVPERASKYKPKIDVSATQKTVQEHVALRKEEASIAHLIGVKRQQLYQMEKMSQSVLTFGDAVRVQKGRTESIGWFEDKIKENTACPFCQSNHNSARAGLKNLLEVAQTVRKTSENITEAKQVLDREIAEVRKELRELETRLNVVRKHRDLLEERSKEMSKEQDILRQVFRFVGQLEQALRQYYSIQDDSRLAEKVKELESRLADCRRTLNERTARNRLDAMLQRVNAAIQHYARLLDIERPADPTQVDIQNLTLKVISKEGREDYLWEIGSGANWMGYHVATLLALHEHFLSLKDNPVPSFLVIDQPSQVYFPEGWPEDDKTKQRGPSRRASSVDIANVRKVFSALAEGLKRTKNKLQVVVIEHADDITWKGISEIGPVTRWRGGDKLIPSDWG